MQQIERDERLVCELVAGPVHEREPFPDEHLSGAHHLGEPLLVVRYPAREHLPRVVARLGGELSLAAPCLDPSLGVANDRNAGPIELLLHDDRFPLASTRGVETPPRLRWRHRPVRRRPRPGQVGDRSVEPHDLVRQRSAEMRSIAEGRGESSRSERDFRASAARSMVRSYATPPGCSKHLRGFAFGSSK